MGREGGGLGSGGNSGGTGEGNSRGKGEENSEGKRREVPSFLLFNTARLITPSGRSKASFLKDQADARSSMFLGVTETWLNDGVLDSEVTHDFSGFS